MTPPDVFARALAAALLDGDWQRRAMLARLRDTIGVERPWMHTLVRAARSRYANAPAGALGDLTKWLRTHEAFDEAVYERHRVIHYATPAPEMAESPWRVPALATTRELATYLGIDLDSLDILADRRGISRAAKGARLQALFQAITWK